jgi:GR25 family glycosyltransferase involved in LPS biosynthesis
MYLHGITFNRFSAVNGSKHIFSDKEIKLLNGIVIEDPNVISRDKNNSPERIEQIRKNVMACALSHISIWKNNIGNGPVLTLEDDVIFYNNFKKHVNKALDEINNYDPDWHILWISSGDPGNREIVKRFNGRYIYKMDPPDYNGQGAMGYILSNKGIEYFTEYLDKNGCCCGIDIFLLKALDIRHAYGIYTPLVFAGVFESTLI